MSESVYRVRWTQGNGYRCSCCRRTWDCTSDHGTLEEAQGKAQELLDYREGKIKGDWDEDDNADIVIEKVELIKKLY